MAEENSKEDKEGQKKCDQKVDPWTVQAAEGEAKIDYDKLIGMERKQFFQSTGVCLCSTVW